MKIHSDESYKLRLEVSTKAFNNNCLIFSPESQKWSTPREFLEANEKEILSVSVCTIFITSQFSTLNMQL